MIAAGGTAGHVVPAIAVADALRDSGRAEVSFIGTRERAEADLVPEAGYEIDFLNVTGISRRNPLKAAAAAGRAAAAVPAARKLLRARGAEVVLGGGGYVAGPVGLAATGMGLPLVLTEADSHLGLANRVLARRARRICLAFPIEGRERDPYLVTGRPVPKAVLEAEPAGSRRHFGIPTADRCIAVFGGSLGSLTINETAFVAFGGEASGTEHPWHPWVIHVTGRRDYTMLKERWAAAGGPQRYILSAYESSLGQVLAAADLVVARAGGSVMEIAAAGRPAILVPYPRATADHQTANAVWMQSGGAAIVMPDSDLTPERLAAEATSLLDDGDRLSRMGVAARKLARPDAADRIAAEVLRAAGTTRGGGDR